MRYTTLAEGMASFLHRFTVNLSLIPTYRGFSGTLGRHFFFHRSCSGAICHLIVCSA